MSRFMILFIFIITLLTLINSQDSLAGIGLKYESYFDINKKYIHIKIKVNNISKKTDKLYIDFPILPSYSSEKKIYDYSKHIHNLSAYSNDKELNIEKECTEYVCKYIIDKPDTTTYIEYEIDKFIEGGSRFFEKKKDINPLLYFNNKYCYFWTKFLFLVPYTLTNDHSFIHVKFDIPNNWKVLSPFEKRNDYFAVECDDVISYYKHFQESAFYMGIPEYYREKHIYGTTHKIAKMKGDENNWELTSPNDLDAFMDRVIKSYNYYVDMFNHNPFIIDLWMPNFKEYKDDQEISGSFYTGNGWHYWPEGREFEITCHLIQSWMFGSPRGPLMASTGITKGIGEYYFGLISSYELFKNNVDFGKIYYAYLVYDRIHGTNVHDHYEYDIMKGYAIGILLDVKLKEISNNKYSLKDVLSNIYKKYHLTNHTVTYNDIQDEIYKMTKDNLNNIFSKYVYGDQKIPVYQYISDYKQEFENIPYMLNQTFHMNLYGKVFPLFLLVEITLQNNDHIMAGMYIDVYLNDIAETAINKYGIDSLTKENLVTILSDLTGKDCSGFFSRWEDTYGILDLNDFKEWLLAYQNDTDNNGLVDSWEKQYFGDIHHISGGKDDYDEDELPNVGEQQYRTDPTKPDTDGDGFKDGEEIQVGTDPTGNSSYPCIPLVKANGAEKKITLQSSNDLSITITLDPGDFEDQNADYWIADYNQSGWSSFVIKPNSFGWKEGINRCIKIPLFTFDSIQIPPPPLFKGKNWLFFVVDDNADNKPDVTWWDYVQVNVE